MKHESSKGKIIKILTRKVLMRKVSQEPQEVRSSRSSRGKILKRKVSQDHQEERFSIGNNLKILKIIKRILKRNVADFSLSLVKLDMY